MLEIITLVKEHLKTARDFESPDQMIQVGIFTKIMENDPKLWSEFLEIFEKNDKQFQKRWVTYVREKGLFICTCDSQNENRREFTIRKEELPKIDVMIWSGNTAVIKLTY